MTDTRVNTQPVRSDKDLQIVRNLFTAYTKWLDLDLTFQDYSTELTNLPGKYAPPYGELFLAKRSDGEPIGCVALRPLPQVGEKCCEMKRLYTVPAGRGLGAGKALVAAALDAAARLGYAECRLDTLPRMQAAVALYESVGFAACEAYYETPLVGTVFLSCNLENWTQRGGGEGSA